MRKNAFAGGPQAVRVEKLPRKAAEGFVHMMTALIIMIASSIILILAGMISTQKRIVLLVMR